MEKHDIVVFKPYEFKVGQKIYIDGGPRSGDWEVIGLTDKKVKLKCPVSHREFEWNRFCYFAENQSDVRWPHKD